MDRLHLNILELFGGIGACTKALKNLHMNTVIQDYVEINQDAVKSYNAINSTSFLPQDICKWNKKLDVDLIMHGSPCTNFSLAGKQEGGDENSGTASSLMYETLRIVDTLKPKYVVWENVSNLLSDKHIHNFKNYIIRMNLYGYNSYYKVLNARNYGIPQNRERVFTVSIRKDLDEKFIFPIEEELHKTYFDYLEDSYEQDVILNQKELTMLKDFGAPYSFGGFVVRENIYPTITASYGKVSGNSGKIKCKEGYRILTPKECWRLMGFDDEDFEKASKVCSNAQLYKQAGNSIVVNVLEAIFASLFDIKLDKPYKRQPNKLF